MCLHMIWKRTYGKIKMEWILILYLLMNTDNSNCCHDRIDTGKNGCSCKKTMERPAEREILKCGPSCDLKNMMPPSWHSAAEETKCDCE